MGVAKEVRGGPDSDSEEEERRQAVLGLQSVSIGSGTSCVYAHQDRIAEIGVQATHRNR